MQEKMIIDPDAEKINFISIYFNDEEALAKASEEDKLKYKEYIKEGVKKDWIIALYALAYGCYGGNEIFKCDWVKSRDTLLKIIELQGDEDPFIYNTLGYIYYYGRCDGTPDYDMAFKYFSVGAANGVFESMYKLADMYIAGKGVPKSEKAGSKIILDIFEENRENFCNEGYDSKFADVALRLGGLFEKGIGLDQDYEAAYFHYVEAKYALEKRMSEMDYYGDSKVMKNIEESIARVMEHLTDDFFIDDLELEMPELIGRLLHESVALDVTLEKEGNDYYLNAERYASDDMPSKYLLNIPEMGYIDLIDSIRLKLKNAIVVDDHNLPKKAFIDTIAYREEDNTWLFKYRDMIMLEVACEGFIFENEYRFED